MAPGGPTTTRRGWQPAAAARGSAALTEKCQRNTREMSEKGQNLVKTSTLVRRIVIPYVVQAGTPPYPKETEMQTSAPPDAPLSPHWAFVVQLRQGTALTPQGLHGRVEHIVSGRAVYFTGLEELGVFLAQVLAPGAPPHPPS